LSSKRKEPATIERSVADFFWENRVNPRAGAQHAVCTKQWQLGRARASGSDGARG
jgi:hypothetical protein